MDTESGIGNEQRQRKEEEGGFGRGEEEEEEEEEEEGEEGKVAEEGIEEENAEKGTDTERGSMETNTDAAKGTPHVAMAHNSRKNCASNANDRKATAPFAGGGTPTTGATNANALTVEKYLMHLRQKEERIRQLEEENRTLKCALLDKSRAYQAQVDQLTGELVRNAEMVARLQSELALNKGASIITHSSPAVREFYHQQQQQKKARKVPSSSVAHSQNKQQPLLTSHHHHSLLHNGGTASTRPSVAKVSSSNVHNHQVSGSKCANASTADPDDICAALQHFVERNRPNQTSQQQSGTGVVEALMGVLKGGGHQQQGDGTATTSSSTSSVAQPTNAKQQTTAEEEEQLLAAQLFSGLLFGSDSAQQHHLLDNASSASATAAATVAENGEVNSLESLDPTSLFALSMLFDEMAANDGGRQQNATVEGQQQTSGGTQNNTGIKREPQLEQQQNIDFEEVMQRVIGGTSVANRRAAVNSIGGASTTAGTHAPLSSVAVAATATAPPLVGQKGTGKGPKKKGAGKARIPTSVGTPSRQLADRAPPTVPCIAATTAPTMVQEAGGVPIALPKGSSNTSAGRKSLSSSVVGVPLLKADQFSPHSNGSNHSTPPVQKPWSPDELKLVKQLESRIDDNIVKLGPCSLNTAELAAQCTRLMRGYSIGQRLFARTVMVQVSQSQGSLSELLSKPRPWHKLTDKGREAFRRIFGWISDDLAIDLLCQLSPRKVALTEKLDHPDPQSLIGAVGDQGADLCGGGAPGANMMAARECGGISMVNVKMELGGGGGNGVGRCGGGKRALKSANAFANAPPSKRMTAVRVEQHPSQQQQQATPLFDQSSPMTKLISKENGSGGTATTITLSTPTGGAGGGRWRHDDIPKEKIIDIYEAEKAKLMEQECHHLERGAVSLSSASPSISPPPARSAMTAPAAATQIGRKHFQRAGSAFSLGMCAVDEPQSLSSVCSPSSTASVVDHPQQLIGRHGSRCSELLPVQFDRYPVLDTEEVVRQIRECLIDGQISQHQFGKTVLGLSQGSVSDLLARPKPWNSLTNKGREPFIRMQMFLEDKKPIKVEVMNSEEYEGEAMECTRDNRSGEEDGTEPNGEETTEGILPSGKTGDREEDTLSIGDSMVPPTKTMNGCQDGKVEEEANERDDIRNGKEDEGGGEAAEEEQMRTKGEEGNSANGPPIANEKLKSPTPKPIGKTKTPNQHQAQQQQIVATVDEVDTAAVARRVRAVLADNGFSQRAFGEHILKTTSGCVSDLLAKPKPWVMLSYKGREAYSKMVAFLDDPNAVDRLKADEEQRCAVNSALNALKAMGGAEVAEATLPPVETDGGQQQRQTQQPTINGCHPTALETALSTMGLPHLPAVSPCGSSGTSSPPPPPPTHQQQPNATSSALQLIAGLASGELGSHTPIGTLLKKTNSPNSAETVLVRPFSSGGALKRKAAGGAAVASSLSMVSVDKNNDCSSVAQIGSLVPPAKKIPRFQRTIITDKQKEALLFIFAHEQRPNSRCIEQLALKLGLTPRTVTNWFHNYRTRQKAKEAKPEAVCDESSLPPAAVSSATNVPTPAQILARALNSSDSKTTNWFRELAELLRMHSDVSVDVDSIGGSRCSVGTASLASSPPSPSNVSTTMVSIQLMGDEGQIDTATEECEGEEEEERTEGTNDGGTAATPYDGEGSDGVAEETREGNNVSPLLNPHAPAATGRQLDKAIARMHSRLLTGFAKGQ